MHSYHSAMREFPPGAKSWAGDPYNGPGNWYDNHGWYSYIVGYIEANDVLKMMNLKISYSDAQNEQSRRAKNPLFACPSDGGREFQNEWMAPADYANWAQLRGNYVVNWGNTNYAQVTKGGVKFLGAPFMPHHSLSLGKIPDGSSHTLMMSEILVFRYEGWLWGGPMSDFQTALGGQTFNGWLPPNSKSPDDICRIDYSQSPWCDYLNGIPMPNFTGYDETNQSFGHAAGTRAE